MNLDLLGFFKENFKDILYIVGAVITFFVGRRLRFLNTKKVEVNVQSGELENVEAALKIYRLMLEDLQKKLTEAEEAYKVIEVRLHREIEIKHSLIKENEELKNKLNEVTSNS